MIDGRTKNYFKAIRENIGWQGYNAGWDGIEEVLEKANKLEGSNLTHIDNYSGYFNSSDIKIYRYEIDGNERFCAEFSYQTDVDDYCVETHIFSKKPSRDDVLAVVTVNNTELKFKYKKMSPEFTCWECGKKRHWLDNEGDLNKKIDMLEDKYCGC